MLLILCCCYVSFNLFLPCLFSSRLLPFQSQNLIISSYLHDIWASLSISKSVLDPISAFLSWLILFLLLISFLPNDFRVVRGWINTASIHFHQLVVRIGFTVFSLNLRFWDLFRVDWCVEICFDCANWIAFEGNGYLGGSREPGWNQMIGNVQ